MGRLIDDNLLKKGIKKWLKPSKPDEDEYISITDALVSILQEIEEQPTAFDVDKVVKQLETMRMRYYLTYANTGNKTNDEVWEKVSRAVNNAIEIVKGGGV
ncbi:MAG: hypothetical protein SOX45_11260 [Lachnospiraceae bacterium]|nr:hypothetical protein [Lachnospiraceae bacterium]